MKKVALICLAIFACTVVMGATFSAGKWMGKEGQVEKIVKAVAAFYKGCESEEASIVMAEIAIVELSKKEKKNPIPYLEKALEGLEKPGLRNFTKFLIANCQKENGDIDKALDTIMTVITEKYSDDPVEQK